MAKKPPERGSLSRERILGAALAIVDRDGLDAISMRRLGEVLGVEAMSLYHHVPNKAAILDGIFETVLAELPPVDRSGRWEAITLRQARALRDVLRAHPNTLPLFATRPAVTMASLTHLEDALDVLRNAGFRVDDALSVLQVVLAFVVGHTISAYGPRAPDDASTPAYDALSPDEFPRVREVAAILASHDVDAELDLGLDALVRGLAGLRKKR
ncbi:MAG: TetR/AcrR family transcriptional regulator C-terminal domain-containing protein [Sandaracinaceae bacterium]